MSIVLGAGDLLDATGNVCESGYAFSQVKKYSRAAIKGLRLRIKEWDYYCFCDDKFAVALTVADNSYMTLGSVSVIDFRRLKYTTKSKIVFFPCNRLDMPSDCSKGDVHFDKGGVKLDFVIDGNGVRILNCEYKEFDGKKAFACELKLNPPVGDNITVVVPFEKARRFYYNTKINCLTGCGWFSVGDERHEFNNGCGGLDWGRGVWPYKNTWYWSSLSCMIDGKPFGLNLGYGFGKPTASENVIFFGGKGHKLGNVRFDIPHTAGRFDYLKTWSIVDDAERLKLTFYPLIDRKDKTNALIISTDQHQVFGKFYGEAILDDGTIVTLDGNIGFAERVTNKW